MSRKENKLLTSHWSMTRTSSWRWWIHTEVGDRSCGGSVWLPSPAWSPAGFSSGFLIDSMQLKYILGYFYQNENEVIYIVYYLNKIETQNGHYCYQYMLLHLTILKTNFVWGVALIAVFRWYYLIYLWCRAHVSGPMCCLRAFQGSQHLVNMQ